MMYSAYKLNKQGNSIQPWCAPFPIWNQSIVPCLLPTVASWPAYRFLRRQINWSGIPISWRIFHSLLWSRQSEVLVWSTNRNRCLSGTHLPFQWSMHVGNLISGSSAISKSSLNIWKFTVHVLLKPGVEYFELYFASVWDECSCVAVWTFFGIAFLGMRFGKTAWVQKKSRRKPCMCVYSAVSSSVQPDGLWPSWLLCLWDFPGENIGVGCHFLLQRIFPTQG